jgi:hypothetical protein
VALPKSGLGRSGSQRLSGIVGGQPQQGPPKAGPLPESSQTLTMQNPSAPKLWNKEGE